MTARRNVDQEAHGVATAEYTAFEGKIAQLDTVLSGLKRGLANRYLECVARGLTMPIFAVVGGQATVSR
jgi:hypothetical protein